MNLETVQIEKLVHGGQGIGELPDGRKVFVWNALPGESVRVRLLKQKKGYAEGIAEEIVSPSPDRIQPLEPESYLATSPWQIMNFTAENRYKHDILVETFAREHVELPTQFVFNTDGKETGYRSKMEWGFWGDEDGISLAHFVRGSHGKTKVQGSVLAIEPVNTAAKALAAELNQHDIRASDLKSVIVRASQDGNAVAALFVKREQFPQLAMPEGLQGLVVYYSNPKSPASVPTRLLQASGTRTLHDTVLGTTLMYDVLSFFQVNLPVFELAVQKISEHTRTDKTIDMYSGVGSIGIPLGDTEMLIELDEMNVQMARKNIRDLPIEVVQASAESALDYVRSDRVLIVDPPRAGLHTNVIGRIASVKPPTIAYLSCNPATQARDVRALIDNGYEIVHFSGYNFFPRTPHIESLAVLRRK